MKKTCVVKNRIERVCIVGTVYSFLLYLLYCSEQEFKNTFFFVGDTLASLLKGKGIDYHCFNGEKKRIYRSIFKISLKFFSHFRWSFLKTAKIFGQDHIQFFSGLVKDRNYSLLEDAPSFFSSFSNSFWYKQNQKLRDGWKKNIISLLYGKTFVWRFGESNQCENIILTQENDLKFLKNKTTTLLDLEKTWQNSSEEKQKLILNLFNVDLSAPIFSAKKSIILLTQPFYVEVPNFSEEEQVELYKEIIERHDKNEVILKAHPRDKINYHKSFSDIEVFDKPIPMQFLSILGVKFEKAVTVSSSAALDFPYKIEVEKIGLSCRKKLEDYFGAQS